jgi:hypothetical protein
MSKVPRWVWFTAALVVPSVAFAATGEAAGLCSAVCSMFGCPCG